MYTSHLFRFPVRDNNTPSNVYFLKNPAAYDEHGPSMLFDSGMLVKYRDGDRRGTDLLLQELKVFEVS
jgi:hypothetical protein